MHSTNFEVGILLWGDSLLKRPYIAQSDFNALPRFELFYLVWQSRVAYKCMSKAYTSRPSSQQKTLLTSVYYCR